MRHPIRFALLILLGTAAAGCIDFPVDEWDGHAHRARRPAPTVVALPAGETNIYVSEPVYYAGPIYTDYTRIRRRGTGNVNVYGTGTYRGVNYGVGYGSRYGDAGGYGWANGRRGNTSWSASWGYPSYGSGYGGHSYGIYGNGNGPAGGGERSRFSEYR